MGEGMRSKLSFVPFLSHGTGCKCPIPPSNKCHGFLPLAPALMPLSAKVQEGHANSQVHIRTQSIWILRQLQAYFYVCLPNAGYIYPTYACSNCTVKRNVNINERYFLGKDIQGVFSLSVRTDSISTHFLDRSNVYRVIN